MRTIAVMAFSLSLIFISACATQRFGRETPLSPTEKQMFTCKDIQIEIAKSEQFLASVRKTRAETNTAHVLGFFGDFGIGNSMEGDAAEKSGEARLQELRALSTEKGCTANTEPVKAPATGS